MALAARHNVQAELPCFSGRTNSVNCSSLNNIPIRTFKRARALSQLQTIPHVRKHALISRGSALEVSHTGRDEDDEETPSLFELAQRPDRQKPLVRVRFSVHYRVHSRQMLCIGGSQMPLGWSFLSIAKVPMKWSNGDIWTCEVDFQAGQWVEYKYVILEEQDWTKLENDNAQGLVEITYRTALQPGKAPDIHAIQKQMAIVAWQPGPNRALQVPTEAELQSLQPGQVIQRMPARPNQQLPYETSIRLPPPGADPFECTWEVITTDEEERPFLDRHDVWGWTSGTSSSRSQSMNSS